MVIYAGGTFVSDRGGSVCSDFIIILFRPSGISKSFIAFGLYFDLLKNENHELFRAINQLSRTISLKDLSVQETK